MSGSGLRLWLLARAGLTKPSLMVCKVEVELWVRTVEVTQHPQGRPRVWATVPTVQASFWLQRPQQTACLFLRTPQSFTAPRRC